MFNSSDDTVLALQTGRVDAIVVDLPTAFYMVAAQIDDGVIIGQFDDTTGGEEYGIVLPKGSKLTPTVSAAVDSLAESGNSPSCRRSGSTRHRTCRSSSEAPDS